VDGVTGQATTGGSTMLPEDVPVLVSTVAVMVTVPAAVPVTSPLADTTANAALDVVQLTMRPVNGLPNASYGVAVSCCVAPTRIENVAGLTTTVTTGTVDTVTVAGALVTPSHVAVICAGPWPPATAVTSPLADTVATAVFDDAQLVTRLNSVSRLAL
jgi:hypothetical protein